MKLTFPPAHKTDDLRPLYEEFRDSYPDVFTTWLEIEKKGSKIGLDELKDVQTCIYDFLRRRVAVEGHMALTEGFVSFRKIIVKDNLGYDLIPGQN